MSWPRKRLTSIYTPIVAGLSLRPNIVKNTNVLSICSTRILLSFNYLSGHTKTLNYIKQTTEQRKRVRMVSKPRGWMLILLFSPLVAILLIGILNFNNAWAQGEQKPEDYVIRRIDVWGLFYRLMVAAFVVGSVVQGSIVYVCWRFRESNPKNRVREPLEGAHQ
jgi:hypothetical protein